MLLATMASVIIGSVLDWNEGHFLPVAASTALLVTFLLQIGSNLINGVSDSKQV